ncbi:MAG: thiamine phosphate synthase [Candidatus Acidiferrales bacterium]
MFSALYAILDPSLTPEPVAFARQLADAGVQLIQLRDKRGSSRKIHEQARELMSLQSSGVRIIVNDRPDIAAIAGAAGVHVGQDDLPVEDARKICRPPLWVGVSTHNLNQLREADATSADYIAVGPIFPTSTKENPDPVVGLDLLRAARQLTRKPLVAIGGVTVESAEDVFAAGADSVAVIKDLALAGDDLRNRVRGYQAAAERARKLRS